MIDQLTLGRPDTMKRGRASTILSAATTVESGHRLQIVSTSGYMLMMSYISPLATACCTVATPSLRLAFSV